MFRVNVQNIHKAYKIYEKPHDRLMEALLRKQRHSVFKALEDISFYLGMGQSLGIIGDNGAGKSTLLKLLAGTVRPTAGTIDINGRVAALLELGAGFHPEFTGRQNIHLNASLLGIPEYEILEKEDEIIEFAELEKFIDRPVRTYSSGMYVRLAFSIATTVEPDILIIDEALAVGDIAFQRKCIQKMNRFKEQGKTMLFCSHSMYHVQELCDKVIWLENGKIRRAGTCDEVAGMYEDLCSRRKDKTEDVETIHPVEEVPEQDCKILSFTAKSLNGKDIDLLHLNTREPIVLEMEIKVLADGVCPGFGFAVMKDREEILGAGITQHDGVKYGPYSKGQTFVVRYIMDSIPLRVGSFLLLGAVADESGLLWYDKKYLGPFTIAAGKGVGMISVNGSWEK